LNARARRDTIITITAGRGEKRVAKKNDQNSVKLSGNLVKDPVVRVLPSGTPVFNLRIASNRTYTKKDGTDATDALFINVSYFPPKEKEAEAEALLKKGAGVVVEGTLSCRMAEFEGHKREFFEVRAFKVEPKKAAEAKAAGEKAA